MGELGGIIATYAARRQRSMECGGEEQKFFGMEKTRVGRRRANEPVKLRFGMQRSGRGRHSPASLRPPALCADFFPISPTVRFACRALHFSLPIRVTCLFPWPHFLTSMFSGVCLSTRIFLKWRHGLINCSLENTEQTESMFMEHFLTGRLDGRIYDAEEGQIINNINSL